VRHSRRECSRFFSDDELIDEALFPQTGHHVCSALLKIVAHYHVIRLVRWLAPLCDLSTEIDLIA
jgi:propanediol utilization protein